MSSLPLHTSLHSAFKHYHSITRLKTDGASYFNIIDHFLHSGGTEMVKAAVIHDIDNNSDHEPIYCTFPISTNQDFDSNSPPNISKPSWKKANQDERELFKCLLDSRLESIVIPTEITECKNINCKIDTHLEAIEWFANETLVAIESACLDSLPSTGSSKKVNNMNNNLAGFNEEVKPFKDNALFWFNVWKCAGKPTNCVLHNIMKSTKNIYHRSFKKCQRNKNLIKKNKLLNACINGDSNLFEEIKTMRKTHSRAAKSIDGVSNNIPNHFRNIYNELYNKVNDINDVELIKNEVESKIKDDDINEIEKIDSKVVNNAIKKVKSGKNDPIFKYSSDCFKTGSVILNEYLTALIKSFFIHGFIPTILLLSTLMPIIKDKLGSINVSSN